MPDRIPLPDAPLSDEEFHRGRAAVVVRRARQVLGLSERRFAARCQVPLVRLRAWEAGRRMPDKRVMAFLRRVCLRRPLLRSQSGVSRSIMRGAYQALDYAEGRPGVAGMRVHEGQSGQGVFTEPPTAAPASPTITDEEAAALARATVSLFRRWGLTDAEACILLGGMSQHIWLRWKNGEIGGIDRDARARMAILMGIHKALRCLFVDPDRGYAWIRKPNTVFGGRSALDVLLRGGVIDLMDVRAYLDDRD